MKRNPSKYQTIVIGKTPVIPKCYCENPAIPNTEELEMLGVTVDDKMKFKKHIANMCRKVSWQVAVPVSHRKQESVFASHLSFLTSTTVSETWQFCNKSDTGQLEKIKERALRFVFNEKQTPYSKLLNRIGHHHL